MKRLHPFPAVIALAVLGACSVGPDYAKPETPPITLASPQAAQFAPPQADTASAPWWTFLGDDRLTRWITAALGHNHDIRQAQASLKAARAVFDERELDRLPAVTAQGAQRVAIMQQVGGDGTRRRTESWRAGFDAQWEVDLFGRLSRLSQAAEARAEASEAELKLIRLSIAAEVARSYFDGIRAQRQLDVARAEVENWHETIRLLAASNAAGSGLPEELENARANLLRSEAAIPPLEVALQQAGFRLDVLAGRRPGQAGAAFGAPPPAPLAGQLPLGDVDNLIRNRPDVVQAERLLAASVEDVGAATADLYPRLNVGGFIGFFALRGADLGTASARAAEFAPGVSWPAFHIGTARARLRGTEALSEGAMAAYELAVLRAQEEVEQALTQVAEHQRRLSALVRAASYADTALDIATRRYRAGSGAYLAVLENQRALFQIRQDIARAEADSYVNVVALYKALAWGTEDMAASRAAPL